MAIISIDSNLGSKTFEAALLKFSNRAIEKITDMAIHTGEVLQDRLRMRTPVDTGTARRSWILTGVRPSNEIPTKREYSQQEQFTKDKRPKIKKGESVWLVNNQPYIRALNNGHSQQAARGFVEVTVNGLLR